MPSASNCNASYDKLLPCPIYVAAGRSQPSRSARRMTATCSAASASLTVKASSPVSSASASVAESPPSSASAPATVAAAYASRSVDPGDRPQGQRVAGTCAPPSPRASVLRCARQQPGVAWRGDDGAGVVSMASPDATSPPTAGGGVPSPPKCKSDMRRPTAVTELALDGAGDAASPALASPCASGEAAVRAVGCAGVAGVGNEGGDGAGGGGDG